MLSLPPRQGAGVRHRARAFAISLALTASLAAAPDPSPAFPARGGVPESRHLSPLYCQAAPPSLAGKGAGGLGSNHSAPLPAAAPTYSDAALQRLAEETDQIKPAAPDALARLRTVIRGLIEIERAQCRETAALRARPNLRGTVSASPRRSRQKSPRATDTPPLAARAPSLAGEPTDASGTSPTTNAPAAGALFGKRGLKKVHRAGCRFGERIKPEDRIYFKSMQEAAAAGYEACKICKPGGG
jgi:hypothetical protein